jgi:hypothetical protein
MDSFWGEVEMNWRHRNEFIVPVVYAASCVEGGSVVELALVMQLISGGSLESWTGGMWGHGGAGAHAVPPLAARARALYDAARGLNFLHSARPSVTHADVKPSNILVDEHGKGMLSDLGLARLRTAADASRSSLRGARGTPAYMAPELRHRAALTTAADVYSFAITAWEMLVGESAHADVMAHASANGADPVWEVYAHVDAGGRPDAARVGNHALAALLTRAWDRDPATRPIMADFVGALRVYAEAAEANVPVPGIHAWHHEAGAVDARDPRALVAFLWNPAFFDNAAAITWASGALGNIAAGSDNGVDACVAAHVPTILASIALRPAAQQSEAAVRSLANAFASIARSERGIAANVAAMVPARLVALCALRSARESTDAACWVARALGSVARVVTGRNACIEAGAPVQLLHLAESPIVSGRAEAVQAIAGALLLLTLGDAGLAACIAAGAPLALLTLAECPAVQWSSSATKWVCGALRNLAMSREGEAACLAAGAAAALVSLTRRPAVRSDAGAAKLAVWAISNLATSDAGKAACIEARAPYAIKDLGMVVYGSAGVVEWVARALANIALCDAGSAACTAVGALELLYNFAANPDYAESAGTAQWLGCAFANIARDANCREACVSAGVPRALVALASRSAAKSSAQAALHIARAMCYLDCAACVAAGAPVALVALARAPAVQDSADAIHWVARALFHLAKCEGGGHAACVKAEAISALAAFAECPSVVARTDATEWVARALGALPADDAANTARAHFALLRLSALPPAPAPAGRGGDDTRAFEVPRAPGTETEASSAQDIYASGSSVGSS